MDTGEINAGIPVPYTICSAWKHNNLDDGILRNLSSLSQDGKTKEDSIKRKKCDSNDSSADADHSHNTLYLSKGVD